MCMYIYIYRTDYVHNHFHVCLNNLQHFFMEQIRNQLGQQQKWTCTVSIMENMELQAFLCLLITNIGKVQGSALTQSCQCAEKQIHFPIPSNEHFYTSRRLSHAYEQFSSCSVDLLSLKTRILIKHTLPPIRLLCMSKVFYINGMFTTIYVHDYNKLDLPFYHIFTYMYTYVMLEI